MVHFWLLFLFLVLFSSIYHTKKSFYSRTWKFIRLILKFHKKFFLIWKKVFTFLKTTTKNHFITTYVCWANKLVLLFWFLWDCGVICCLTNIAFQRGSGGTCLADEWKNDQGSISCRIRDRSFFLYYHCFIFFCHFIYSATGHRQWFGFPVKL